MNVTSCNLTTSTVYNGVDTVYGTLYASQSSKSKIVLNESSLLCIDDFEITGYELRLCLSYLKEITRKNKPEEFI